jgi:hypothetical protein
MDLISVERFLVKDLKSILQITKFHLDDDSKPRVFEIDFFGFRCLFRTLNSFRWYLVLLKVGIILIRHVDACKIDTYCGYLMIIPCVYIDLWVFTNDLIYFVYNSAEQENPILCIFTFRDLYRVKLT